MVKKTTLKNKDEWRAHRRIGIGGSDAACILGLNPWKSNVRLWEEKTGLIEPEDISDSPLVSYGTNAEEFLRNLFRLDFPDYCVGYEENNSFENDKYPWALASLDGWLLDRRQRYGILEIKTTTITQRGQWDKWNGRIPDNYYCQLLHYMAVTEYEFAELKAQIKTEHEGGEVSLTTRHYHIERSDVEDDIAMLMKAEEAFWENVQTKTRPALILPGI